MGAEIKGTHPNPTLPKTDIGSIENKHSAAEVGRDNRREGGEVVWDGMGYRRKKRIFVKANILRGSATSLVTHYL